VHILTDGSLEGAVLRPLKIRNESSLLMSQIAESDVVTISASAARRLNAILKGEDGAALRISVKGGGCSGFQYSYDIDTTRADDDFVATRDGATVVVDPVSLEMMKGSEVDFVDDLMGQSFRIKNPNATASCGCGVSFSV
jgi:iron-sulfur cluster assembly accessory protein